MILANIILLFCCIFNGSGQVVKFVESLSGQGFVEQNVQKFSAPAISEYEQFSNQSKFNSALTTEIFPNVLLLRLKVMI